MNKMNRISLSELYQEGKIEPTGAKPKLPVHFNGINSQTLRVCHIPLEYLYHNNNNGRIATHSWSASSLVPQPGDSKYNDYFDRIIKEDDPKGLRDLQKSLKSKGQEEFGYVLNDGRVIDGNRRYTALREIQAQEGTTQYFEAVILPLNYEKSAEQEKIKKLELALQMGIEEKKPYDPVELAVDIHRTCLPNKPYKDTDPLIVIDSDSEHNKHALMSIADYAEYANIAKKEVYRMYDGIICVKYFLKYIGAPNTAYSIVKDSKTWSLFTSMADHLRKFNVDDELGLAHLKETMASYFAIIAVQMQIGVESNTLRTRIRDYGKRIVDNSRNKDFNDAILDLSDDLSDFLQDSSIKNYKELMESLESNYSKPNSQIKDIQNVFNESMDEAKTSRSIEDLVKQVKNNTQFFDNLRERNGLLGRLSYDEIERDQLLSLKDYTRKLNQITLALFDLYGQELQRKDDAANN